MSKQPTSLDDVLAGFDQAWSPRIVAFVNDYDVRVAKFAGEHVWHVHENTDEFFLVLDGEIRIGLRDGEEREVVLRKGDTFVVPRGVYHKPSSVDGASVLLFEPTGTLSVGDRHDPVPEHVDETTGHVVS
ncbi:cupin domain-containing protein [Amycolatopsis magusensis]|uniref:Mannose-6-phosphate isomerase-like protein (Cupin superfamily) n=1 Tax=Amycolatopsis magusensis TaxID=882444 RepID=A0ABS4PNJ6_9PSEU|nr:cupin domain-containing protein [Amycolatopsis magusensis]MBP2181002.1 mannose-6-phosphate isomerase-like protein (cupin superfamily) [Amycolatopsis magusensis]